MVNLEQLIQEHDNDYGFDPRSGLEGLTSGPRTLSIVVPYFETGPIFRFTLLKLRQSISEVCNVFPDWLFEIIIVDDGSLVNKAWDYMEVVEVPRSILERNDRNTGRMRARQRGLYAAKFELCAFMDSDILLDPLLLLEALLLYQKSWIANGRHSIIAALFENVDSAVFEAQGENLLTRSSTPNDFRIDCVYQQEWIGCEADLEYVGSHFQLLADTSNFRKWKGRYKAWLLSNMVLGGFFMVQREDALRVGGFDSSFNAYGFTETTLVTKLIALRNHLVVPVLRCGAIHLDASQFGPERAEKDRLFRDAHRRFFSEFLKRTPDEFEK